MRDLVCRNVRLQEQFRVRKIGDKDLATGTIGARCSGDLSELTRNLTFLCCQGGW